MTESTLYHVVGTRPNLVKIAPLLRRAELVSGWRNVLIHTGQHYDDEMSNAFFRDLGIRAPDVHLGVGSGGHGAQTAWILEAMERLLLDDRPDLVVVVGDVNSTVAAALAAAKLHIPVAHVEAGLRSGDRRMPEELNRLVTDQLSDLCLTPSLDAAPRLRAEGIGEERIHFVGNIMIDTLLRSVEGARELDLRERMELAAGGYIVATLHRPSNVDDREQLAEILGALDELAAELPVILPLHPRTRARISDFKLESGAIRVTAPLGYLDLLHLMDGAALVLTDSGGIQEETTVLGVPCLTLRSTTERPVTITEGTNRLVPERSRERILEAARAALAADGENGARASRRPEGWDGRAAERIVDVFSRFLAANGGDR